MVVVEVQWSFGGTLPVAPHVPFQPASLILQMAGRGGNDSLCYSVV